MALFREVEEMDAFPWAAPALRGRAFSSLADREPGRLPAFRVNSS
jgi:hypothetical protein